MTKIAIKLATAASTAALVVSSLASPLVATTVEISGNGADSSNTVNVAQSSSNTVNQSNTANISNNIDVDSDTGNNEANDNTGGDVAIDTGDANSTVMVSNTANSNQASIDGCCPGDVTLTIKGNGSDNGNNDANTINFASSVSNTINQSNNADFDNDVDVDSDTGKNDANGNTGGDVSVMTGDADADITVMNTANANWAAITSGANGAGSVAVEISGNGSDSSNEVNVALAAENTINQSNNADIENDVDVDLDTGKNDANDNTGGDVSIDTGDATATVDISNLANFNAAELDGCGCVDSLDVLVKGNGSDSENEVNVALASLKYVNQTNTFDCDGENEPWGLLSLIGRGGNDCNDVDVDLDTGKNDVNDNTHGGDPSVMTGDADADVTVENTANSNVLGDVDFDLPDFPGSSSSVLLLLLALFS